MTDRRRTRLGFLIAAGVVAIAASLHLRTVREIERTANRRFGLASFEFGSIVDGAGAPIVVPRAAPLVVPPGAAFRFDGPAAIPRADLALAFEPEVSEFTIEIPSGSSGDRAVLRVVPGAHGAGSAVRTPAGDPAANESPATEGTPLPGARATRAAELTIALNGGQVRLDVSGRDPLTEPCLASDLRGATLRATGGAVEVLRIDPDGDASRSSERNESAPPVPVPLAPPRVVFSLALALVSGALFCWFARRGPSRVALAAAAAIALATIAAMVAYVAGALGAPYPEARIRGPDPIPAAIDESLHLHAGNQRRLAGPFLDFTAELRFATAWNSSLEVSMFGDAARGEDTVVFRLATDPRLRTGFLIDDAATGRWTPLGFDLDAFEANRLLDVTIVSDAGLLRAYAVDALADEAARALQRVQPVAEAFVPASRVRGGPLSVRATRGAMRLDRVAVSPPPEIPLAPLLVAEPQQAEFRSRVATVSAFLLAIAILAAALRRGRAIQDHAIGVLLATTAVLPVFAATVEPPLRLGVLAAALGLAPAAIVLSAAGIVAIVRAGRPAPAVGAALSVLMSIGVAAAHQGADPQRSPLALGSDADYLGFAYEPDLALERHAESRREIPWRRDPSLHGDLLEPRRPGDRRTIVVLGDSRLLGLDATGSRRSGFAALVERGVATGAGRRGARVIDATWERASLAATLTFLEEVLLAKPGRDEARALSFAPDVALIVLPIGSLRAGRDADLLASASRDAFRGLFRSALDDARRVIGEPDSSREQAAALGARFARIAREAAAAGCRILVASPIRQVELPIPAIVDPHGVVDLFFPTIPAGSGLDRNFHRGDVLSVRGAAAFSDLVARFLRKRVFTGDPR